MDDGSPARLEQLFPRLGVLAGPVRLQLSELLATPTSAPAVLTPEIAALPVPRPVSDDVSRAVRSVIEKSLGAEALAALQPLRLDEVVPPIRTCQGGPLTGKVPVRLRELLRRQGTTTWAELASLTVGEMGMWATMGRQTLAALVGAAVEAALRSGDAGPEPAGEPGPGALALLLRHERAGGGGGLRGALTKLARADGPAEVRSAAAQLLAAADREIDPRLALLDQVWQATGDHRNRGIFVHRALRLDGRTPTKELAQALGVSDCRISEIQTGVGQRVRQVAGPTLGTLAADLRDTLGDVCRIEAIDDALAAMGLPTHADPRLGLLVWLAGPYLPVNGHGGWVATEPATVLAETKRLLREDGGVRQADHVAADLRAAGFAPADVGVWLRRQPVTAVGGLVVDLSGSSADVAERLLSATGRALTAAELVAAARMPCTADALDTRLRRDARFVRTDQHHFEPAEWGSAPFTDPTTPPSAQLFPPAGRSQLRIEVDAAVLRGAGDPVPLAVVEALGVPCGGRRTFTTRFGPVALSHAPAKASRGSVRPVALAAGARAGDALVLDFDAATGDASVALVLASSSAAR